MKESEIIAEAERLLGVPAEDSDNAGYVTTADIRRVGYTDYAVQKALQTLFVAGMLDTIKVQRKTRAGHYQSFPAYRVKAVPQS